MLNADQAKHLSKLNYYKCPLTNTLIYTNLVKLVLKWSKYTKLVEDGSLRHARINLSSES